MPLSCIDLNIQKLCKEKLSWKKISRQQKWLENFPLTHAKSKRTRNFLMLELLIALFLVGFCALPLVKLPMRALKEEIKSCYRIQMHRLADLAFAEIKERLYRQEISWKDISRSTKDRAVVLDDSVTVGFEPLGMRKFKRKGTLYSIGKKNKSGEEMRLVTFQVEFKLQEKKSKLFLGRKKQLNSRVFTYQILLNKTAAPPPFAVESPKNPKDSNRK